jgi:hypothetical protein
MLYQRNAKTALAMGAGLTHEYRGILSMLIDLMALHDNGGIPADTAYIAGNLNIGSRKWNQSVLPTLLNAQKIKKVKRGGIDVYIWAHPEWATGPKRVIQMETEAASSGDKAEVGKNHYPTPPPPAILNSNEVLGFREDIAEEVREVTGIRRGVTDNDPSEFYNLKPAPPAEIVAPPPPDPAPKPEPQPDIAPAVSAMDVLERAGIDVSNHPRGDLFWARVEHNVTLEKWLETIPLNEIVARLARAQQQGLIDDHVNSLASYDQYVLEEG